MFSALVVWGTNTGTYVGWFILNLGTVFNANIKTVLCQKYCLQRWGEGTERYKENPANIFKYSSCYFKLKTLYFSKKKNEIQIK